MMRLSKTTKKKNMYGLPRFIQKLLLFYTTFICLKVDRILCYDINFVNTNKTAPKIEGKIVGGVPTPIERYPYAAIVFNYGSLCGGTILTSWSVLTAAHCFDANDDVYDMTVHVGARHKYDTKSDIRYVQHLERHKEYNKAMPFACDVAILFVEVAFTFSDRVQRAVVIDTDKWMSKNEKNFTVTGWGMIRYNGPISDLGLLMAQLRFIPLDECGRLHDMTFTEDMFCLYGEGVKDTCKGDSGGGVIWNGYLVGVVSHGAGCAGKNQPSVYANVYYFRDWISKTINDFYKTSCTINNGTSNKNIKRTDDRTLM